MKITPTETPFLAWYRVPEMWLILLLLGATVIGSFALLVTAMRSPDTHIIVPMDVPRPSTLPPTQPSQPTVNSGAKDDGSVP